MENRPTRTAAYCRVSTDMEEQESSYELQVQYYWNLIQSNPEMELVGIYGDKGKTGLSAKRRPGLQRLIEDCKAGKIDLILTKSISRFSRKMSECAAMVRELGEYGVDIHFEKENVNKEQIDKYIEDHHEGIISRKLWDMVQAMLEENMEALQRSKRMQEQILSIIKDNPSATAECISEKRRSSTGWKST